MKDNQILQQKIQKRPNNDEEKIIMKDSNDNEQQSFDKKTDN